VLKLPGYSACQVALNDNGNRFLVLFAGRMSFVSNDKHVEKLRIYEAGRAEELKARNAKVSGRKHELMDRCVLFIRMTYCRARVSLFDEEKV